MESLFILSDRYIGENGTVDGTYRLMILYRVTESPCRDMT